MSGRGEIMVGDKPLSSLRVVDLKAELEKRGLSKSGSKKDLVDRLKASLLLDKDREEAVSASNNEEELPNIAAKLPDDNPFVREYLASQAELFHSQQVAKKLYREEQKRESEGSGASADERERSPLKSPSKVSDSTSSARRRGEDKAESSTTPESSDREKSPEKRATRGRPALASKSTPAEHLEEPKEDVPKEESPKNRHKSTKISEPEPDPTQEVEKSKEVLKEEASHSPTRSSRRGRRGSGYTDTAEAEPIPPSTRTKSSTSESETCKEDNTEVTSTRDSRAKSPEKRSTRSRVQQVVSKPEVTEEEQPMSDSTPIPVQEEVVKSHESTTEQISEKQLEIETEKPSPTIEQVDEQVEQLNKPASPAAQPKETVEVQENVEKLPAAEEPMDWESSEKVTESTTPVKLKRDRDTEGETSPSKRSRKLEIVEEVLPPSSETKEEEKSEPADQRAQSPKRSPKKSWFHQADPEMQPLVAEKVVEIENIEAAPSDTATEVVPEGPKQDDDADEDSGQKEEAEVEPEPVDEPPFTATRAVLLEEATPVESEPASVASDAIEDEADAVEAPVKVTSESHEVPEKTPPRKVRSHSPITAPTPDPVVDKPRATDKKEKEVALKHSTSVEKESILDEVLDYGEEDVEMTEEESASNVKRSSAVTKALTAKDKVTDDIDYGPIDFERRVLKLKPNRYTQRRREKMLEDRKAAEKEEERERSKIPDYTISTEVLLEWFPNFVLLTDEEMVALEEANAASSGSGAGDDKVRITRTISNLDVLEGEEFEEGVESVAEEEEPHSQPEMDLTIQRKISIISMEEEMTKGDQTPPRRAPTQLILVTNLVRPFTVPQLKELLQRTGNVVDLWVDKIKSRCVAKYDTEDEAVETRTALHGVKWPTSNPKTLSVDFTTEERAEDLRKKDSGYIEDKPVAPQHVREWDVGKKSPPREARKRSHSRERDRDRDGRGEGRDRKRSRRSRSHSGHRRRSHSRTSHSDRKDRNGDVKKSESSGKTLDELFRKTVCVPCIYWLPLNPQQILEKEELRRKRMEERERRIAEIQQQQQSQRLLR